MKRNYRKHNSKLFTRVQTLKEIYVGFAKKKISKSKIFERKIYLIIIDKCQSSIFLTGVIRIRSFTPYTIYTFL